MPDAITVKSLIWKKNQSECLLNFSSFLKQDIHRNSKQQSEMPWITGVKIFQIGGLTSVASEFIYLFIQDDLRRAMLCGEVAIQKSKIE